MVMKELFDAWRSVDRNKIAVLLSVIPGLGHLYKHHYLDGLTILVVGNAMMVFVALWLAIATVGLSLILVPAIWMAGVAYSAFYAEDKHGAHPYLHVWEMKLSQIFHRR